MDGACHGLLPVRNEPLGYDLHRLAGLIFRTPHDVIEFVAVEGVRSYPLVRRVRAPWRVMARQARAWSLVRRVHSALILRGGSPRPCFLSHTWGRTTRGSPKGVTDVDTERPVGRISRLLLTETCWLQPRSANACFTEARLPQERRRSAQLECLATTTGAIQTAPSSSNSGLST